MKKQNFGISLEELFYGFIINLRNKKYPLEVLNALLEKKDALLEESSVLDPNEHLLPFVPVIPLSIIGFKTQLMYTCFKVMDASEEKPHFLGEPEEIWRAFNGFLYNEHKARVNNSWSEPYFLIGVRLKTGKELFTNPGALSNTIDHIACVDKQQVPSLLNHSEVLPVFNNEHVEAEKLVALGTSWDGTDFPIFIRNNRFLYGFGIDWITPDVRPEEDTALYPTCLKRL